MKIKSIHINNFAGISEFSSNLGPGVNYIVAGNGQGKSSVGISAIWSCLKGIAERGDAMKGKRLMFVGNNDDEAEITLVLTDGEDQYKIRREIAANKLEITSTTGKKLDQSWLNSFFSEMMLSPIAFSRLTPKEQAAWLGIDTSQWDEKIAELKQEHTLINRELSAFGEVEIPEKVELADISQLIRQKNEAVAFNEVQKERERMIRDKAAHIESADRQVQHLMQELQIAQVALENRKKELAQLPEPEPLIDTNKFDSVIAEIDQQNSLARKYEEAVEKSRQKEAKAQELQQNKADQKAQMELKTTYMQSLNLPAPNLTIDDNGGLMFDGRPIATPHLSHSELIKVCVQLIAPKNENFKYVFLEDFDVFDDKKAKETLDWLLERGYQVLAEKVNKKGGDLIILQDV